METESPPVRRPKAVKAKTERELVDMLRPRYEQDAGNGVAGCVIPQVRNQSGWDASRTLDAIGVGFWKSRGLLLHGYECKSSRSDWQRELKDPSKAENFCERLDKFSIIAGAEGIVLDGEIPEGWGLLVAKGRSLVEVKPAPLLHPYDGKGGPGGRPLPPNLDRSFLVTLLRAATKQQRITPQEIKDAYEKGRMEGEEFARGMSDSFKDLYEETAKDVREFQQASGIVIGGYRWNGTDPKAVGEAVRLVLNGDTSIERVEARMRRLHEDCSKITEAIEQHLAEAHVALDAARAAS